jgi:hypothetical protein
MIFIMALPAIMRLPSAPSVKAKFPTVDIALAHFSPLFLGAFSIVLPPLRLGNYAGGST